MTTLHAATLLTLCTTAANAFVAPAAFVARDATTVSMHSLPDNLASSFQLLLADDEIMGMSANPAVSAVTDAMAEVQDLDNGSGGSIIDSITTLLSGVTAILFFLFGLTYVLAAWIIPQAAKQLEEQTKELDSALWAEYEAKLEPGQTMDQRPELMQELGDKMQKLMAQKFDEMEGIAKDQTLENEAFLENMDAPKKKPDVSQVVDAEIVPDEDAPKEIRISRSDDPWSD